MRILIECPKCRSRQKLSKTTCTGKFRYGAQRGKLCGYQLKKIRIPIYWIDYDVPANLDGSGRPPQKDGVGRPAKRHRRRERIGASREAAEYRLREIAITISEHKVLKRDRNAEIHVHMLLEWYIRQKEVQDMKSYGRYQDDQRNLVRLLPNLLLRDLRLHHLNNYRDIRLAEPSKSGRSKTTASATVSHELSYLRSVMNYALRHEFISEIPVQAWPKIKVDNKRDRVLTTTEWKTLEKNLPKHIKEMAQIAYYTGMRQGEILQIEWSQFDFEKGFVRLRADQTKSKTARAVSLCQEAVDVFKRIPKDLRFKQRVFVSTVGRPYTRFTGSLQREWKRSLKKSAIEDFSFHDLRHCYVSRMRLAGIPDFLIQRQVGHKDGKMTDRYTTINESELILLGKAV